MLPAAIISHQTSQRVRIKITSRKGDVDFFTALFDTLNKEFKFQRITVNALTGSVLMQSSDFDLDAIADIFSQKGLCRLDTRPVTPPRLVDALINPVKEINRKFRQFSRNEIDIHEIVFIALCSFGIYEILKGNFRTPPWYTAFWYAFGVFTMSMADRATDRTNGVR